MANPFQRFARGAISSTTAPVGRRSADGDGSERLNPTPTPPVRKRKLAIKEESSSAAQGSPGRDPTKPEESASEASMPVDATSDRRIELLQRLVEARSDGPDAPIDTYGTQACIFRIESSEAIKRFQILVAALLSSQTQDPITHGAMMRLHTLLDPESEDEDGLTIAKVRHASVERLQELLVPVGFYRRKAQQLKQIAETLDLKYKGDIPRSLEDLLALPGIGPKIARVILQLAWDQVDHGLIVDTHVHRLSQRLGWVPIPPGTKTPEETRSALEDWVPREYWRDFSRNVVGFGQNICVAVYPKCIECPLAPQCPSAFSYRHPSAKLASTTKKQKVSECSEVGCEHVQDEEDLETSS